MPTHLMVHMVDYVSTSNSRIGGDDPEEQKDIICITIRPDRGSYRPHNLGLPKSQAQRLLSDLQRLLTAPLILLLFTAGCSARVEVTQEPSASATTTVVAVDVLADPEEPVVINVTGDLHVHLHQVPHRILPTSQPVRVDGKRPRRDTECARLRKEHFERVKKWKEEMGL